MREEGQSLTYFSLWNKKHDVPLVLGLSPQTKPYFWDVPKQNSCTLHFTCLGLIFLCVHLQGLQEDGERFYLFFNIILFFWKMHLGFPSERSFKNPQQ